MLAGPALGGFLFERLGFAGILAAWGPFLALVAIALSRVKSQRFPSMETL